jgi:hypothetical protein
LHLHDGALTARVTATPLREVMAEVSRLSGAQVVWLTDSGERHASADFTALPFDEGLRRLLDRYNFLLVYVVRDEHSTLSQIWISSAIDATIPAEPALPPVTQVSSAPPPSEEHWDEALGAFAQRDEMIESTAFLEEERKAMVEEH